MGWTVLYIAFGVVALWLLGEVLLQYKARLRWRLLAFGGFMGVVLGALMPSVLVIGLGIAAFATGQTFVTLSYRRGFSTGWALGGSPGSSRRRRGASPREADPSLEVSDLQTHVPGAPPEPVDDYGYAGYQHAEPALAAAEPAAVPHYGSDYGTDYGSGGYGSGSGDYGMYGTQPDETQVYANPAVDTHAYAYADEQQQYAAYSADPYVAYDGAGVSYDPQGTISGGQPSYAQPSYDYAGYGDAGYGASGYGDPGYGGYGYPAPQSQEEQPHQAPYFPGVPETPPGGVWVPQQRDAAPPPLPPEQPPRLPEQPPMPAPYGYADEYQQYPNGYYNTGQQTGY